jgi:RNA polymerase sigma factor (sigma-70 family)
LNQTYNISLAEQIELCKQGDSKAYYQIYKQYAKAMLNSSMRIVNNLADAEDMVQDAFVDAFKKIETYQFNSPFEAWLRRIVINKSISFLRKKKAIWVDVTTVPIADAADDEVIDENQFTYTLQRVQQAVEKLPAQYKLVFNLFAIDELPQEEIGQLLGIAHNNVRIQYHRAKKKILEILQNEKN